jgi:hypothetical protein
MNDFQETVALFNGSAVVPASSKRESDYALPDKECPPRPTNQSFAETHEEPVNLEMILPRWWPVTW